MKSRPVESGEQFSRPCRDSRIMAEEVKQTCYEGSAVQSFEFYLKQSGEHQAIQQSIHSILPAEFKRIGARKSSLNVLGVGSGAGEMDIQILRLLQSTFPDLPITADAIEGSTDLIHNFKAMVAKSADLQKIPFGWHPMKSEAYAEQVKAKGDAKRFDFIHMIQMLYYVDDLAETIKFYHGLLQSSGRLMIIIEAEKGGWDNLWTTFSKDLCVDAISVYRSSREVMTCLKTLGLKYEEHIIPNSFDISECFDPSSSTGQQLLNFMTAKNDFQQSFTPETQAAILHLLRHKCSSERDGKILFNSEMRFILVHA